MKARAVCIATAQPIDAKSGRTGAFKTPQPNGAFFNTDGVQGDTTVDTDHHGGPEQAAYIFTETDRLWWQAHLDRDLPPGYFGENLLIDGPSSTELALGDIFEIGSARLQITSPRIPCVTFNARIGDKNGVKLFNSAARPGAYARVLTPGHIRPDDRVTHVPFDGTRITIAENFTQYLTGFKDTDFLRRASTTPAHVEMITMAKERLAKNT